MIKQELAERMEKIDDAGEAVIVSSQPPPFHHPMPSHHHSMCPPDCTIWMGDLNPDWTDQFIREAFGIHGANITNVKLVMTDHGQRKATYCFVEFRDEETAREAILDVNGKVFPNTPDGRFNLAFANSPNNSQIEYNLFVNNLDPGVDDVALFQLFGRKYRSCRGAKVYRDEYGRSKEQGFVRFTSETDQQTALIDMNKMKFQGKELLLKLAKPKARTTGSGRFGGHPRGGGYHGRGHHTGGGGHGHTMGGPHSFQPHNTGFILGQMPPPMAMPGMMPTNMQYVMMPGGAPVAVAATPFGTQMASNHGMAGFGGAGGQPIPQQFPTGQPVVVGGGGYQQAPLIQPQYTHMMPPGPMIQQMATNPYVGQQPIAQAMASFNQPHLAIPPQPAVPIYEDVEPPTAAEHNAYLLNLTYDMSTAIDASRWGPVAFPPDTRTKQLQHILQAPGNL